MKAASLIDREELPKLESDEEEENAILVVKCYCGLSATCNRDRLPSELKSAQVSHPLKDDKYVVALG